MLAWRFPSLPLFPNRNCKTSHAKTTILRSPDLSPQSTLQDVLAKTTVLRSPDVSLSFPMVSAHHLGHPFFHQEVRLPPQNPPRHGTSRSPRRARCARHLHPLRKVWEAPGCFKNLTGICRNAHSGSAHNGSPLRNRTQRVNASIKYHPNCHHEYRGPVLQLGGSRTVVRDIKLEVDFNSSRSP